MEILGKDIISQVPGVTKIKIIWKILQFLNNFFRIIDRASIFYAHHLHRKRIKSINNKTTKTANEKRFLNRNYYLNSNHEIYTILHDNTVIYTRIIEIEIFKDGDCDYKFSCGSSNGNIGKNFNEVLNNQNRFNEFSFVYDIIEDSHYKDNHIKPILKNETIKRDILNANIIIKNLTKGQKLKLAFSFTLPKDFDAKIIDTNYSSACGMLHITIQKEIYGNFNENSNFLPKLKSVHHEKVYQPLSYKNLYYQKFYWKLWQWDWKNGEINLKYDGNH
ncbi:hypothetical protein [Aliarcobacter butzleri]|uniref:hypothetical protein n=1 Tax=Aliarcobacter butzleri TaxID=28197 RepID=UPI00125F4763|nr:hypothetical protein [Aliarcobacter butzleri]